MSMSESILFRFFARLLKRKSTLFCILLILFGVFVQIAVGGDTLATMPEGSSILWWQWSLLLFIFTLVLGSVAIVAGLGGGVLFVPIAASVFPFHLDFVRGAGLLVALSSALSASPILLKKNLANLRLAVSMALISSLAAIFGAKVGLLLPAYIVQIILGSVIIMIVFIMYFAKKSDFPIVPERDKLSVLFGIGGTYYDEALKQDMPWQIHRMYLGFVLFAFIGFMAGMFGLGAGWANVPVLNQVLGVPLKMAAATSILILSITDTSAAWVYITSSAELVLITVPSVIGMMLGARIGVKLLSIAKPAMVKWVVIVFLTLSGVRSLLKGFGIWE